MIVHGLSGVKITKVKAAAMIIFAFAYAAATITPAFLGVWGGIMYGKGNKDLFKSFQNSGKPVLFQRVY